MQLPTVSSADGETSGVAQIPRVGELHKSQLTSRACALSAASVEVIDMALRSALDL
ncbi:hypothetical protein [Actinoplanes cyaneus]|uniref:hypothetical protein n=1 Tax=Actinoplanes cyaneus TaxID=52696 RepID=UPI001940D9A6|nr:hypothetical protein [Actinoplanes cyaneus]MCW2138604.1 hypothetical protein [Actinoplanes cyaneus]